MASIAVCVSTFWRSQLTTLVRAQNYVVLSQSVVVSASMPDRSSICSDVGSTVSMASGADYVLISGMAPISTSSLSIEIKEEYTVLSEVSRLDVDVVTAAKIDGVREETGHSLEER
jgi:3-keto-L-gulonate-6-phosphate decarboxylase